MAQLDRGEARVTEIALLRRQPFRGSTRSTLRPRSGLEKLGAEVRPKQGATGLSQARGGNARSRPDVHRLRRLRGGGTRHAFAPIPKRPEHHVRYHLIVARIRAEEAGLVEHRAASCMISADAFGFERRRESGSLGGWTTRLQTRSLTSARAASPRIMAARSIK